MFSAICRIKCDVKWLLYVECRSAAVAAQPANDQASLCLNGKKRKATTMEDSSCVDGDRTVLHHVSDDMSSEDNVDEPLSRRQRHTENSATSG